MLGDRLRAWRGISGNIRAAGARRIDDLGSPKGRGRGELGRTAERGAVPSSDESGGPVALAVLEAGKQRGRGACPRLLNGRCSVAVPGGAFRRRPEADLTQAKGDKQASKQASTRHVQRWRLARGPCPLRPPSFLTNVGASDRGGCSRRPNRREPARRGIFLENCRTAEAWPNR